MPSLKSIEELNGIVRQRVHEEQSRRGRQR